MNPATFPPSSIVSAAANGSAALISPTRTGIRALPIRAPADKWKSASSEGPLALAQQWPCEFLTETRAFASVNGHGVPARSVCAPRANYLG